MGTGLLLGWWVECVIGVLKLEIPRCHLPPVRSLRTGAKTEYSGPMKTVAILGASNDRNKFGNKAVRAFLQHGDRVWPVNPKETAVEGLPAFKTIAEVPGRPDLVSVYLPPPVLLKVLPDIATRDCGELWLNPGTDSAEVIAAAEGLGLNVIRACSIVALGISPATL